MITVGIDGSLSSTGFAVLNNDSLVYVAEIKTDKRICNFDDKSQRTFAAVMRCRILEKELVRLLQELDPDVVCVEAPSKQGYSVDRLGMVQYAIHRAILIAVKDYCVIMSCSPKGRAQFATGNGNADKTGVMTSVVAQEGREELKGRDDACDAVALARLGRAVMQGRLNGGIKVSRCFKLGQRYFVDKICYDEVKTKVVIDGRNLLR